MKTALEKSPFAFVTESRCACRVPALLYTQEPMSDQRAVFVAKLTVKVVKLFVASKTLSTLHTIGNTSCSPVTAIGIGMPPLHQLSIEIEVQSPFISDNHQRVLLAPQRNNIPLLQDKSTGSCQMSCTSWGFGLGINREISPFIHSTPFDFCCE